VRAVVQHCESVCLDAQRLPFLHRAYHCDPKYCRPPELVLNTAARASSAFSYGGERTHSKGGEQHHTGTATPVAMIAPGDRRRRAVSLLSW